VSPQPDFGALHLLPDKQVAVIRKAGQFMPPVDLVDVFLFAGFFIAKYR
jgi:hypothetical protein